MHGGSFLYFPHMTTGGTRCPVCTGRGDGGRHSESGGTFAENPVSSGYGLQISCASVNICMMDKEAFLSGLPWCRLWEDAQ